MGRAVSIGEKPDACADDVAAATRALLADPFIGTM